MITKNGSGPERVQESWLDPIISTLSRREKKRGERYQPGLFLIRKRVETNIRTYDRLS